MASMCFAINGKKFFIPVPIRKFPPDDPNPPDPIRWIETTIIPPEVLLDISVLAGIEALVKTLKTPSLQEHFAQSLHNAMPQLGFPKDVSMNLDDLQGATTVQR